MEPKLVLFKKGFYFPAGLTNLPNEEDLRNLDNLIIPITDEALNLSLKNSSYLGPRPFLDHVKHGEVLPYEVLKARYEVYKNQIEIIINQAYEITRKKEVPYFSLEIIKNPISRLTVLSNYSRREEGIRGVSDNKSLEFILHPTLNLYTC